MSRISEIEARRDIAIGILERASEKYLPHSDCIKIADSVNDVPGLMDEIAAKDTEIERLNTWVNDLQSGMYVNCVYCGHRYGPENNTPASMADILKAHVEQCPKHPMSALRVELAAKDAEITKSTAYMDTLEHVIKNNCACSYCANLKTGRQYLHEPCVSCEGQSNWKFAEAEAALEGGAIHA